MVCKQSLVGETIIRVACGDGQTIAVSLTGEVWGWGCYKDKEGKQWFNPTPTAAAPAKDIKKKQDTPILITGLKNIVEVACGASFNLALDTQGIVYSWGLGESGELGRKVPPMKSGSGEDLEYDKPAIYQHHITPGAMMIQRGDTAGQSLVRATGVKSIGCGAYHSFVSTVGDEVYSCGLNNYGQLGHPIASDKTAFWNLEEVKSLSGRGIIQMRGGMHHSLVLSSSGTVYSFGRGDSGQLGYQDDNVVSVGGSCSEPHALEMSSWRGFSATSSGPNGESSKIVQINCGGNHNLALANTGDVYTWGYGDMLALGHGDDADETIPRRLNFNKAKIKNITVTQVAGGGQHSAIIGRVVST